MSLTWYLRTFEELSTTELYTILALRQDVFVVEQNCPYLDCDNKDQTSHHLLGWLTTHSSTELVAYLRILIPENQGDSPHIGRVVCHRKIRQKGIGKELIQLGIANCTALFPTTPIKISAQQYLVQFYLRLGFRVSSEPYDEDGIPHIGMTYDRNSDYHNKTYHQQQE